MGHEVRVYPDRVDSSQPHVLEAQVDLEPFEQLLDRHALPVQTIEEPRAHVLRDLHAVLRPVPTSVPPRVAQGDHEDAPFRTPHVQAQHVEFAVP